MKFLSIALSATAYAFAIQSQSLCSAALKSFDGQPTELTDQESNALFQYQCSKDSTCSSAAKPMAISEMATAVNNSKIQERMGWNTSSVEVFTWGYRVYVPNTVATQIVNASDSSCEILTGPIDWCFKKDSDMSVGAVVFCSLFTGPFYSCTYFLEKVKSFNSNGKGVILRATWITALLPSIEDASKYFETS